MGSGTADYIPSENEPLTPAALRTVAAWLDTYDRLAAAHFELLVSSGIATPEDVNPAAAVAAGKEMQTDLRRWADEMEVGPKLLHESTLRVLYHVVTNYQQWRKKDFLPNELMDNAIRIGEQHLREMSWWPVEEGKNDA